MLVTTEEPYYVGSDQNDEIEHRIGRSMLHFV